MTTKFIYFTLFTSWYGRGGAAHAGAARQELAQPLPLRYEAGDLPQVRESAIKGTMSQDFLPSFFHDSNP